jgi:hypothetical protein
MSPSANPFVISTVDVGLEGDESVEITNGLAEGDILYD